MQYSGSVTVVQSAHGLVPPDDLEELGAWIYQIIQDFEEHPDDEVRERVIALLVGVDALHRATLTRLVSLLQGPGAGIVWHRAQQDPLIRALLHLYDLLPEGDAGGEISPPPTAPVPVPSAALKPKSIRLTVIADTPAPPHRVADEANWIDAVALEDLPSDSMRGMQMRSRGDAVLLCNIGGEVFAWEDACPDTPMVLSVGQLDGEEIVCPWHGCRFNARTGERLVHRGTGLIGYPVEIAGGVIRVAMNRRGSVSLGSRV